MFRIEERTSGEEHPEKSVTIWAAGKLTSQRPIYMAVWRLLGEKASFVPLESATTKCVRDTDGTGQYPSPN